MRKLAKDAVLEILRPYLSERPEIRFAYLFGSLAKGTANRLSDVDVAVFLDPEFLARPHPEHSYGYKAHLITELISQTRTNQIDVVILNDASPFLRFQVLRDGIVIFETNPKDRQDLKGTLPLALARLTFYQGTDPARRFPPHARPF